MKRVTLSISFADLFGDGRPAMSGAMRRQRWEQWLSIARAKDEGCYAVWTDTDGCNGCRHLDGYWCRRESLPCTVNPVLSRRGMVGMACMGTGWEARQLELFAPVSPHPAPAGEGGGR